MVRRDKPKKQYRGTGVYVGFVAVLAVLAALVILAAQNTDPVRFSFLQWDLEYPLVAILLATIGGSILLDEAVGWVWRSRRRRVLSERAELKELRAEKKASESSTLEPAEVATPQGAADTVADTEDVTVETSA
ncbi:MAG: lipopolysaccharide assembly protein LapA domain-containing protein [Acidimicrobiia bacterium]|nr:lipopolysaccharide assembly protein LapA domain-containing protein [Acidimicrobiia bacterium]